MNVELLTAIFCGILRIEHLATHAIMMLYDSLQRMNNVSSHR
jgi:hypothetical protein